MWPQKGKLMQPTALVNLVATSAAVCACKVPSVGLSDECIHSCMRDCDDGRGRGNIPWII
jgi:hypothetical protein